MSKKQITTVSIDDVIVTHSWMSAALRVQEFKSGVTGPAKECVIKIREPSDIGYLRDRLDQIEAHWRRELDRYSVAKSSEVGK